MTRVRFTLPQSLPRARHGVCIAHVRKWVWNRLAEIEGWDWYKARIWRLLSELGQDGGMELVEMERRVRREPKLRRLVVELSEKWWSLTYHRRVRGCRRPTTVPSGR